MHAPWCMLGSLTSCFLWSRWRGKCFRHYRCIPCATRNFTYLVRGPWWNVPTMNNKMQGCRCWLGVYCHLQCIISHIRKLHICQLKPNSISSIHKGLEIRDTWFIQGAGGGRVVELAADPLWPTEWHVGRIVEWQGDRLCADRRPWRDGEHKCDVSAWQHCQWRIRRRYLQGRCGDREYINIISN